VPRIARSAISRRNRAFFRLCLKKRTGRPLCGSLSAALRRCAAAYQPPYMTQGQPFQKAVTWRRGNRRISMSSVSGS
jgi:hypothetical protein